MNRINSASFYAIELHKMQRELLLKCLEISGKNVSMAARDAGISRSQFYRLMSAHGIRMGHPQGHRGKWGDV